MRDSWAVSVGIRPGTSQYFNVLEVRCRFARCGVVRGHTQAGQGVDAVNVHGAGTADTLTAGPAESQGRINLVLYPDKSVEHHRTGLLEVELVALHVGLLSRLVRVPAVDLEGLHAGVLGRNRVDILSLDGRIRASEGGRAEQRPRRSEQSRRGAEGGHSEFEAK